ncbi:MAG: hypothetical protein O6944_04160 [Gammaproteobacteria bacterium]|nr:hypothetical protein [Gammaproteobacteria bacterium]
MSYNLILKPTRRKRAVQAAHVDKRNGTKANGKSNSLSYIAEEHRLLHPKPLRNWAEVNSSKIEAINNPGPSGEAALLRALHFQRYSKDAAKFSEAMSAESVTWRRRRS